MIYLLDVSVLIALCDPAHPRAVEAQRFFSSGLAREGWATCPIVENGFLRIFGSPRYPGGPGSPKMARSILAGLLAAPGHQFWPDDLSLLSAVELPASEAITDHYLLAMAVERGGRFATFNTKIDALLVAGGPAAYHVI